MVVLKVVVSVVIVVVVVMVVVSTVVVALISAAVVVIAYTSFTSIGRRCVCDNFGGVSIIYKLVHVNV